MGYLIDDQSVPPVRDRKWRIWSAPVYRFLSKPRSWSELKQWSRQMKVMSIPRMTQCLAWLDHMKVAYTTGHEVRDIRWVSVVTDMFDSVPDVLSHEKAEDDGEGAGGESDAQGPLDEEVDGGGEEEDEQDDGDDLGDDFHDLLSRNR